VEVEACFPLPNLALLAAAGLGVAKSSEVVSVAETVALGMLTS
jgi:hypothetical protein